MSNALISLVGEFNNMDYEYKVTIKVEDNRIGFGGKVERVVVVDSGSSLPDFEEIIFDMVDTLKKSKEEKF